MNIGAITALAFVLSKRFLQLMVLILLVFILVSKYASSQWLYDRLFTYPELRIQEQMPDVEVEQGGELWFQRVAVFQNRGNSTATGVEMGAFVPNGRITRYRVVSDEPYTVRSRTELPADEFRMSADRLAAGAEIILYLWGAQALPMSSSQVRFSAVHSNGSAPRHDKPTALEELQQLSSRILQSFRGSRSFVMKLFGLEGLPASSAARPIMDLLGAMPDDLMFSILVVFLASWLFLEETHFHVVIAVLSAFVSSMCLEEFWVLRKWWLWLGLAGLVFAFLRGLFTKRALLEDRPFLYMFTPSLLVTMQGFLSASVFGEYVHGSFLVGYAVVVLLLLLESVS